MRTILAPLTLGLLGLSAVMQAADAPAFAVTAAYKVGGEGRWDYLICDPSGKRLYVPRTSHTMVLDAVTGALIADIPGTDGVHGVALAVDAGRGFTSNGKAATSTVFDLTTNATLGTIATAEDPDCIIYDPASKHVLACCGDAGVIIPFLASVALPGKAEAPVALGGKPEFAAADGQGKVYVNLVDKSEVAVLDTKSMTVIAHWPLAPGANPTGMSIDTKSHRLYIGCRNQVLIVMNAEDGSVLAHLPIGPGVDATAVHGGLGFASCGDATLAVVSETAPGTFTIVQTVTTAPGARTMAINGHSGTIYMPSADFPPAPPSAPGQPKARQAPLPGSFKILVVSQP